MLKKNRLDPRSALINVACAKKPQMQLEFSTVMLLLLESRDIAVKIFFSESICKAGVSFGEAEEFMDPRM